MTYDEIRIQLSELNPEARMADGFEDALVGIVIQATHHPVALYDREKCLQILMNRDGMTEDEAIDFFEFDVAAAQMGSGTPAFAIFYRMSE
jgi:hypothetical protein